MNAPVVIAKKEKNFDLTGAGCLLQVLGLLAPIVVSTLFSIVGGMALGFIGGVIGVILLVILLFKGFAKQSKWICSNCKSPIESKQVSLCATCSARFE
jgi:hypothetical protein